MTTINLNVSEIRNAGFGDFRAVSAEINGREYGCDVYADGEVQDWQDGNGLMAHDYATEAQVRKAAQAAN